MNIEKELEKKERLIQTYIIVFGILFSYNQNQEVQHGIATGFFLFLPAAIIYYTLIANRNILNNYSQTNYRGLYKIPIIILEIFYRGFINVVALFASFAFSTSVFIETIFVGGVPSLPDFMENFKPWIIFLILVMVVTWWSLYIPSIMLKEEDQV